MLKILDFFKTEQGYEYFGVLDDETNIINYVTHYDLQSKYHDRAFFDIDGIKHSRLNSVGYKLVPTKYFSLIEHKDAVFDHLNIPRCVDYDKIIDYSIHNIPIGYRILKDNIVYTFQKSSRMGMCWRAHLCVPYVVKNPRVRIEKMILGYPVKDLNHFFNESKCVKPKIYYDFFENVKLDFSQMDFKGIEDISYFLYGFGGNITLGNFNIEDVHYCNNAFMINNDVVSFANNPFQFIDISSCKEEPFILQDTDMFKRSDGVQVFIISDNKWLFEKLQSIEAINLGVYTDKSLITKEIQKIQGKYALMNRRFEKQIYYAIFREGKYVYFS